MVNHELEKLQRKYAKLLASKGKYRGREIWELMKRMHAVAKKGG